MKTHLKFLAVAAIVSFAACNNANKNGTEGTSAGNDDSTPTSGASYVVLNSGQTGTIVRDADAGGYVYVDSRKPIENDMLFVDVTSGDTLYGPKGVIVNNALIGTEGSWKLDEAKVERDGDEIKIKTEDGKIKIDGDEMKAKGEDSKLKVDGDESKAKDGDMKEKTEDDETKIKPN